MQVGSKKIAPFSRQPLSLFSKTAFIALLGSAIICGFMSIFSHILLIFCALTVLVAGLVAMGMRWAPLAGGLVSGGFLYLLLFQEPFPLYHLSHPKDALDTVLVSFFMFIVISLWLWSLLVACGASIGALIQNYLSHEQRTPRWFTPTLTGLLGVLLGVILLGALTQPGITSSTASITTTNANTATSNNGNQEVTVHMGILNFSQASVSLTKGSKLHLVNDGAFHHILVNGSWVNGQPQGENAPGAPVVNQVDVNGDGKSAEVGPFNTAGTYHIYCSLHVNMTLTITVQ